MVVFPASNVIVWYFSSWNASFNCLLFSRRQEALWPQRRPICPIPVHPGFPAVATGWSHVSQSFLRSIHKGWEGWELAHADAVVSTLAALTEDTCQIVGGVWVSLWDDGLMMISVNTEQRSPPTESSTNLLSVLLSGAHHQTPTLWPTADTSPAQPLTHPDNRG